MKKEIEIDIGMEVASIMPAFKSTVKKLWEVNLKKTDEKPILEFAIMTLETMKNLSKEEGFSGIVYTWMDEFNLPYFKRMLKIVDDFYQESDEISEEEMKKVYDRIQNVEPIIFDLSKGYEEDMPPERERFLRRLANEYFICFFSWSRLYVDKLDPYLGIAFAVSMFETASVKSKKQFENAIRQKSN